ncbi:uncharacterized protein [Arachis hypogaea]|uniref:uncharacterized protein n=1 Tax=Arachis hypogaea TaxID=3818 RepID=UPI003B20D50B
MALTNDYEPVRASLLHQNSLPSFEDALPCLKSEESRLWLTRFKSETLSDHLIIICPTRPPRSDQNKYHSRPINSLNVSASTATAAGTNPTNSTSVNPPSISPSDIKSLLKKLLSFSGNTSAALSIPPGNSKWIIGRKRSSGLGVSFPKVIKIFRHDDAMEYRDSKLLNFLAERGTLSDFSCPSTSQQNGRAERKDCQILDSVRAILISSSCPKHTCGEAVLTAVHVIDRLPSSILGGERAVRAEEGEGEKDPRRHAGFTVAIAPSPGRGRRPSRLTASPPPNSRAEREDAREGATAGKPSPPVTVAERGAFAVLLVADQLVVSLLTRRHRAVILVTEPAAAELPQPSHFTAVEGVSTTAPWPTVLPNCCSAVLSWSFCYYCGKPVVAEKHHCYCCRRRKKPCYSSGRQEQSCGHRKHRLGCRYMAQSLLLSCGLSSSHCLSRLELLLLLRVAGAEAASAAGERSADVIIGICRRCRLRWLPGCCRVGPETAAISVQPSFLSFAKRVGLCFEAAFDLGLKRKGLCDAFEL